MVRSKAPSRKQQSRGVDFKKIKRKIGRKLPPPKNATNTEIKSRAIILPEQTVASDKTGLAVSKKGLTLKELLQQSSHHNFKVRKDALVGIRDLFVKYPEELRLHKLAVVEKLRERISDDDKVVRETLYQLFKSDILPACKEDNQGALISLIMGYIFSAMTHLSIDVRLMSFKFLDLLIQHCPPAFHLNAEKILQNYGDMLCKNQFNLQDKGKLKIVLSGLVYCLSLLPSNDKEDDSCGMNIAEVQILHAFEPDIPKDFAGYFRIIEKLKDLVAVLVNYFNEFIPSVHSQSILDAQSFDCMLSMLQIVDLTVRYFVYGNEKYQLELQTSVPPLVTSDTGTQDQKFSPLLLKKLFIVFPLNPTHKLSEKDSDRYLILNIVISEIFFNFAQWICPPPVLMEKFLSFIEDLMSGQISSSIWSGTLNNEKHLLSLLPFVPKLVSTVECSWKARLVVAFTKAFKSCTILSAVKMACLSAMEEMLIPKQNLQYLDANDPEILGYQITWIRELPLLLILLGDGNPSCSQVVLRLLLRLGQFSLSNPHLAEEYDNLQGSLQEFYSIQLDDGSTRYGAFVRLPRDCQELSVCCLYYFSFLEPCLLTSLASCCICQKLEPFVLFRILDVLDSAYKAGHALIADYISFLITLLFQFEIPSGKTCSVMEIEARFSRQATLKSATGVIWSFLSHMGDQSLVFCMLEKVVVDMISLKPPLDNSCAMLRILTMVDSWRTQLSEQSIIKLSKILFGYLIEIAARFPEEDDKYNISNSILSRRYYLLPCLVLFDRSTKLLKLVLDMLQPLGINFDPMPTSHYYSQIVNDHSRKILAVASVILMISEDVKVQKVLSSCKAEINSILESIHSLQSTDEANMSIEERHKAQCAVERLMIAISTISTGIS